MRHQSQDALDHAFFIGNGYDLMKQEPPELEPKDAVSYFEQTIARRLSMFLELYPDCDANGNELGLQGRWNQLNGNRRFT